MYTSLGLVVLLLCLGLALKLLRGVQPHGVPPVAQAPLQHWQLTSTALQLQHSQSLSPGSPYYVFSYRSLTCRGSLALLPLQRNGEAATLLQRTVRNRQARFGFLFEGKLHTEFPTLGYARWQLEQRLRRWVGQENSHPLLAWAELGNCQLPEQLARVAFCEQCLKLNRKMQ
ncbi:MAG: hypothetical protein OIF57_10985 [Marinobacterium sp.]|nr:hypothetical protein [Marinobacterium sp.]